MFLDEVQVPLFTEVLGAEWSSRGWTRPESVVFEGRWAEEIRVETGIGSCSAWAVSVEGKVGVFGRR